MLGSTRLRGVEIGFRNVKRELSEQMMNLESDVSL